MARQDKGDVTLADLRVFWEGKLREAQERLQALAVVEADLRELLGEEPATVRAVGQGLIELRGDALSQAGRTLGAKGHAAGGRARAVRLSPERRSEIARAAARARWSKRG